MNAGPAAMMTTTVTSQRRTFVSLVGATIGTVVILSLMWLPSATDAFGLMTVSFSEPCTRVARFGGSSVCCAGSSPVSATLRRRRQGRDACFTAAEETLRTTRRGGRHHRPLLHHPLPHGTTPTSSSSPPRRSSVTTTALSSVTGAAAATSLLGSIDAAAAKASVSATAKLLSSIGLGGLAAKRPNVLDSTAVSALSRLIYWVFQPAFLLASVSRTLHSAFAAGAGGAASSASVLPGRLLALMPVAAVAQIGLGYLSGRFLGWAAGLDDTRCRDLQMCTSFANSGPLALIFADAVLGSGSALAADAAACISFYLLVWSPLFWCVGRVILGTYDGDGEVNGQSGVGSATDMTAGVMTINGDRPSTLQRVVVQAKRILSPPMCGSLIGAIIGAIPALRASFFGGYLTPVMSSMNTLGTGYIPAAILVLAGSLVNGSGGGRSEKNLADSVNGNIDTMINGDNNDGPSSASSGSTNPSVKIVSSILASRFFLNPLLTLALVRAMGVAGLLGPTGTRARALVSFCILLEGCMPPAQNTVIMMQLEGWRDRAAGMAKLLTLVYALAVVPVTVLISVGLASSGIMGFR